ncbi:hypothetical protein GDN83_10985 [Gordonia jinghuaiqii]|uniref:Acyl-CoA/acyl-ACP dehydrogenase n=1 Tax=Gordonia jinghuaiqii TaxID=2758710 RepID=A0A7D7LR45_9ACTN|nr:acyl-CoA dehydrogenase family protein [Gordonia jinghuaiqii]MCR5978246.1 hypothetical protein [Gordonia jinghuaiqii]QMT01305.1 acyl-CoA/acyl-ACP dehydrogenase [Gordonia jinghuaiqii]
MKRDWPAESLNYRDTVAAALRRRGGFDLARQAESEPDIRHSTVRPLLDGLGLPALDPWGGDEESAAVALAVCEAGRVVLPWPVVEQLAVPQAAREQIAAIHVTDGVRNRLSHADLFDSVVMCPGGEESWATTIGRLNPAPLDPFAVEVSVAQPRHLDRLPDAVAMHTVLTAFWVHGALSTALQQATLHARDRHQFGSPIGRFGEIRWRLADMVVALDGLAELARHTWWVVRKGRSSTVDLLALRVHMLEASEGILSHAHQVLGAMGLCEEHNLTVVDRHLQPVLRRPGGLLRTTAKLADAVATEGFDAPFPVLPWRSAESAPAAAV